jgi:hypothetical protein
MGGGRGTQDRAPERGVGVGAEKRVQAIVPWGRWEEILTRQKKFSKGEG